MTSCNSWVRNGLGAQGAGRGEQERQGGGVGVGHLTWLLSCVSNSVVKGLTTHVRAICVHARKGTPQPRIQCHSYILIT